MASFNVDFKPSVHLHERETRARQQCYVRDFLTSVVDAIER